MPRNSYTWWSAANAPKRHQAFRLASLCSKARTQQHWCCLQFDNLTWHMIINSRKSHSMTTAQPRCSHHVRKEVQQHAHSQVHLQQGSININSSISTTHAQHGLWPGLPHQEATSAPSNLLPLPACLLAWTVAVSTLSGLSAKMQTTYIYIPFPFFARWFVACPALDTISCTYSLMRAGLDCPAYAARVIGASTERMVSKLC